MSQTGAPGSRVELQSTADLTPQPKNYKGNNLEMTSALRCGFKSEIKKKYMIIVTHREQKMER